MEKHVYFVRHGESDSNATGIYQGAESELTEKGRSQAASVAERIARIGVDAIVSSDFKRAYDTAAVISARTGIAHEQVPFLGEWLEPSSIMGRHKDEEVARTARKSLHDESAADDYQYADEETFGELTARAEKVINFLERHPAERICVVSHGAFQRVIVGSIIFKKAFTRRMFVMLFLRVLTTNTGITYIRVTDDRGWQLVSWNDSAHLG